MYQVLARKYRPKTFDEVIGQDDIVKTLKNAVDSDRIAHAYIFSGTRGVGKTSIARILARSINCEKGPTSNPCGGCQACIEMLGGNAVDVIEIDGASNTGVDDIRELKENIMYSPQSLKYKIYIIDEVHMLSKSAFNALLKTLEEPPEHVKFIFATTEIYKVPETILSRCQRFTFKRIAPNVIYLKLKKIAGEENIEISDENLMTIASLSDGSLRDALSTFDTVISYYGKEIKEDVGSILGVTGKETIKKITEYIFKKDYENSIKIINDIYIAGTDIRQFIRQLAFFLRNILVLKLNYKSIISDILEADVASLIPLTELKGEAEILDMIDILLEADGRYQRVSSPLLMMELIIFRLISTPSKMEIKAVLEKLDRIDKLEKINTLTELADTERKYLQKDTNGYSENVRDAIIDNKIINDGASMLKENQNIKECNLNHKHKIDKANKKTIEERRLDNKIQSSIVADGEDFLEHIDSITNNIDDSSSVKLNTQTDSVFNDDNGNAALHEKIISKEDDNNNKNDGGSGNVDNNNMKSGDDDLINADIKGDVMRNLFEEVFDGFIENIKE
ncbi:MAG: DNA polymerase III subunit gamma/tau [Deltaproteobacteria bacterium]|nr:DNA polymerase III subunit gamma/tau [Deltaproteobacteria bacterium]